MKIIFLCFIKKIFYFEFNRNWIVVNIKHCEKVSYSIFIAHTKVKKKHNPKEGKEKKHQNNV